MTIAAIGIAGDAPSADANESSGQAGDGVPWVVPLETASVHGDWKGKGEFRHIVDAASGRVVLEYVEELTGTGAAITLEIDPLDLDQYDLLQFDWRSTGDEVLATVTMEGYLESTRRNYYLNKKPGEPGDWQRVWLDLRLDDDNPFFGEVDMPNDTLRLRFAFGLNPVVEHSQQPEVQIRLADVMFVRLPIRITGDLREIGEIDTENRVGQVYTLEVTNRSTSSQQAVVYLDRSGLDAFAVALSEDRLKLAPGETRNIEARITVDKAEAARRGPLYLEEVPVFAGVEEMPNLVAPWNWGYMQHRVRRAVPLPDRPAPLLLSDSEGEAGRARLAREAESVASERQIQAADALLDINPEPSQRASAPQPLDPLAWATAQRPRRAHCVRLEILRVFLHGGGRQQPGCQWRTAVHGASRTGGGSRRHATRRTVDHAADATAIPGLRMEPEPGDLRRHGPGG